MAETLSTEQKPRNNSGDMTRFIELLRAATPDQKALIRDTIGAGGIKRKKRQGSNADAKQFVARFGEVQHPEGFEVLPPQGIYDKGPAAVAGWFAKREQGLSITEAELNDIVAAATI